MLPPVPGTRSVFAERTGGGYFLDFDWKRDELARYGLTIDDAQMVVHERRSAARTSPPRSKGRERYPVNVRYMRDFRSDLDALRPRAGAGDGRPDADPARPSWPTSSSSSGPAMIRDENGMLTGYVYVDVAGRDVGSYVSEAQARGRASRSSCRRATRSPGAASTRRWSACASG